MSKIKVIEYERGAMSSAPGAVIGLGLFDGVHLGHRALIREVVRLASELSLTPAIFTFSSRSSELKAGVQRIYSDKEKLGIFEELGIELVYSADFSSLSGLSHEVFVKEVLVGELGCSASVAGFNFRFGKGAVGNAELLTRLMQSEGGRAAIIEDERVDGESVSSSRRRAVLGAGGVAEAAELLGSPFFISGEVRHGRGDGKAWGFPTVNTDVRADIPLRRGVYATAVRVGDEVYCGVTNLGTCPSFGERELHAETMLLDFDGDLYGRRVDIYFLDRLRDERGFSSPEELKKQIELDSRIAKERIEKSKWQEIGLR